MTLREIVKGALERAIVTSGAAAMARRRMGSRVLVLAYHNIVPDGSPPDGDYANHLPISAFSDQMAELRKTHDIVPLAETLEPARSTRPRAAITFDDAYQGAVDLGLGELVKHKMPATVFVAPAFIGGRSFWWDALAVRSEGGLDPTLRDHGLSELRGDDSAIRAYAAANGRPAARMAKFACTCSEQELIQAASLPGVTFGSHTWEHPNLVRLDVTRLDAELTKPFDWLRTRFSNVLPWIAYPYGLFNATVEQAAAQAGYKAALAINGGWFAQSQQEFFALPRVNIPRGLSVRGFSLRSAGLLTD